MKRVIFLSTPHHGSYIAGSWLAHQAGEADRAARRRDAAPRRARHARTGASSTRTASGIGDERPRHDAGQPLHRDAARASPIAPGVPAHSIIAVTDPDEPRDRADDGVVEYSSAHIDGVESEFVVVSGHSCQDNPHTIAEVRRILLEHIAEFDAQREASNAVGGPNR